MIGNTVIGKSFKGCVSYVMEKEDAIVLGESGVRSGDASSAIRDFNLVRKQNPNVKNAVWHTSISFAYSDNIDNERMKNIAHDYLKKVELFDNQYLIVRHFDTKHEHVHIIANRIRYNGQTTSDQFCKNRTAKACDELEIEYGLTIAKDQSKKRENDKVQNRKIARSEIKSLVIETLQEGVDSWEKFSDKLNGKGVSVVLQKQSTGRVNGVSFKKNNLSFKGSALDRSFSYGRLTKQLGQNKQKALKIGL